MTEFTPSFCHSSLVPLRQKHSAQRTVKIGDAEVAVNPGFRMFLVSTSPNPRVPLSALSYITVVNFKVALGALEEQIMSLVVRQEVPALEAERDELVLRLAENQRVKEEAEIEILSLLERAGRSVLDNDEMITTFQLSKETAAKNAREMIAAEKTGKQIARAREHYRPLAHRCALLYFATMDMRLVNAVYDNSLTFFLDLVTTCLLNERKERETDMSAMVSDGYVQSLTAKVTLFVFNAVSQGLFQSDRLTYAMLMAVSAMRSPALQEKHEVLWLRSQVEGRRSLPGGDIASPRSLGAEWVATAGEQMEAFSFSTFVKQDRQPGLEVVNPPLLCHW